MQLFLGVGLGVGTGLFLRETKGVSYRALQIEW